MEKRAIATEVRTHTVDDKPTIEGYAAVFNSRAEILPGLFEEIKPGSFDGVLKDGDALGMFNHNRDNLLGRESAGTLELRTDRKGLYYTIDPPDTQAGRDTVTSIKRGDITGSSFSFNVAPEGEEFRSIKGGVLRTITKFSALGDVGPVSYEAYEKTTVSARSKEMLQAEETRLKKAQQSVGVDAVKIEAEARERELRLRG